MRYWNRVQDPDKPESRSRSTIDSVSTPEPSQFGQRPLFSEPGPDQPPPEQGALGAEARLDPVVPTDESEGSEARTDLEVLNPRAGVTLTVSHLNVGNPPTEAQIIEAFGPRPEGWIGLINDGVLAGTAWLCLKSANNKWNYQKFTRAT